MRDLPRQGGGLLDTGEVAKEGLAWGAEYRLHLVQMGCARPMLLFFLSGSLSEAWIWHPT